MDAGRELDALVAEKVMGREVEWVGPNDYLTLCYKPAQWNDASQPGGDWKNRVHRYSTDIAAAWEVVEKLKADGWRWHMGGQYARSQKPWCGFMHHGDHDYILPAETAPLAICLAALKAVGVEVPA